MIDSTHPCNAMLMSSYEGRCEKSWLAGIASLRNSVNSDSDIASLTPLKFILANWTLARSHPSWRTLESGKSRPSESARHFIIRYHSQLRSFHFSMELRTVRPIKKGGEITSLVRSRWQVKCSNFNWNRRCIILPSNSLYRGNDGLRKHCQTLTFWIWTSLFWATTGDR